jgi:hypothetical protein
MMFQGSDKRRIGFLLSPEYGGSAVSGGGHPADSPVPASEAIDDALGQNAGGHGKTPGVGVPGSKTNPVPPTQGEVSQLAQKFWEDEGRPEGKSEEHWRRAEAELRDRAGLPSP